MTWTYRTMILAAALCLALGVNAWAHDEASADKVAGLEQGQQELKAEIAALKAQLDGIQKQLQLISRQLATMGQDNKPTAKTPTRRPQEEMIGKDAPEFSVKTYDGKDIRVGGKHDKPQVLFCWASWCGYCKRALPGIETLHQKYKDKGVEVIAVNLDQRGDPKTVRGAKTEADSLKVYNDVNATMPMAMTMEGTATAPIGAAYNARSFPSLFVIGPDGKVAAAHVGAKPDLVDLVSKEVDLLLAGKEVPK